MENATKTAFKTTNPHSEDFVQFENTRLMDRLQKKFTPKPYWKNYALLRGVVLVTSFLFNVLSAATAAVLVFFLLRSLIENDLAAGAITAGILLALELVKRETGTRFFSDFLQFRKMSPGLAAVVVLMMGISCASSFFGAKRAVKEFSKPAATFKADSATAPLFAQVTAADAQILAASQIKRKGVVTASAQRSIERLSKQKETALAEIARLQKRADDQTDTAILDHDLATKINAAGFGAITLCSEVLLLLCLFYLQFYDYRSFVEFCEPESNQDAAHAPGVRLDTHTPAALNGKAVAQNFRADTEGVRFTIPAPETTRARDYSMGNNSSSNTETHYVEVDTSLKPCAWCNTPFRPKTTRHIYCTTECKFAENESRHGTRFDPGKAKFKKKSPG